MNYLGHSTAYIAQVTHHSKPTILAYFHKHHIKQKQTFNYKVVAPDQATTYYVDTLVHFLRVLKHNKSSNYNAKVFLQNHGYTVKSHSYIWCNVPDGCYYLVRSAKELHIKIGLDSYIYPNA